VPVKVDVKRMRVTKMVTGITYIATSICLALLIFFLGQAKGHDENGDVQSYRYPPLVSQILIGFIPVYLFIGGFIYSTFPLPRPQGTELFLFVLVFLVIESLLGAAYLHFKNFRVELDKASIRVFGIFRTKSVALRDVGNVEVHLVGKGGKELILFGRRNNQLLKLDGSLQDFEYLVFQIKQKTKSN